MYFKITNENENHNGFQYKTGLNKDILPFNSNPSNSCVPGGLYFTDEKHICKFLGYGLWIREVKVPEGTEIVQDGSKYRAPCLELGERRSLSKASTWKWMIKNGVDIHADDNFALRWSATSGQTDVVKLLLAHGANVHACDNAALIWSALNGHVEVVEVLLAAGADVHVYNNEALRASARNGLLEVVKLLLEHGADARMVDLGCVGNEEIISLLKAD